MRMMMVREVGVVGASARMAAASATTAARQIEGIAFVFAVNLGKEDGLVLFLA